MARPKGSKDKTPRLRIKSEPRQQIAISARMVSLIRTFSRQDGVSIRDWVEQALQPVIDRRLII